MCGDGVMLSKHDQHTRPSYSIAAAAYLLLEKQAEQAVSASRARLQHSNCGSVADGQ